VIKVRKTFDADAAVAKPRDLPQRVNHALSGKDLLEDQIEVETFGLELPRLASVGRSRAQVVDVKALGLTEFVVIDSDRQTGVAGLNRHAVLDGVVRLAVEEDVGKQAQHKSSMFASSAVRPS